jgi:hypothetical protein
MPLSFGDRVSRWVRVDFWEQRMSCTCSDEHRAASPPQDGFDAANLYVSAACRDLGTGASGAVYGKILSARLRATKGWQPSPRKMQRASAEA